MAAAVQCTWLRVIILLIVEVLPTGKHIIIAGKVIDAEGGPDPDELLK